jgi:2-oxo-4-hydroxy-4-carboxy-5-ureidoimidazoline decarboxylase
MVTTAANEHLLDALLDCLAVPRWAREVVALGPFDSKESLLQAARGVRSLSDDEFALAMQTHPRIGESLPEPTADRFSSSEQGLVDMKDADVAARIAEGNRLYEARFDRVFLIRSAGRGPDEILGELQRRIHLTDAEDLNIAQAELMDITLRRMATLELNATE